MTKEINGITIIRAIVNSHFRKLANLDRILQDWDTVFFARHVPEIEKGRDRISLDMPLTNFITTMLAEPMNIRIENNCIYFLENTLFKVHMRQFADVDTSPLTDCWFLVFKKKICTDERKQMYRYEECLFNQFVETIYPRTVMVMRYMCLNLLQYPYSLTWLSFYKVAVKLCMHSQFSHIGAAMLGFLRSDVTALISSWDKTKEPYPGFLHTMLPLNK